MAYFPLFANLRHKKVLIVGGGSLAFQQISQFLVFNADIILLADELPSDMTMKFKAEEYDTSSSNDAIGDQTKIFSYDKETSTWTYDGKTIEPNGEDVYFEWSLSGGGNALKLRYYISWVDEDFKGNEDE